MKKRPYFPLLAKVLGWLLLHLVILALAFFGFISWQLGLGLDSLLSGSAGERLRTFGDAVRDEIKELPRDEWNEAISPLAKSRDVMAVLLDPGKTDEFPSLIPANVKARMKTAIPPRPGPPKGRGRPPGRGGPDRSRGDGPPPRDFSPPEEFDRRGPGGEGPGPEFDGPGPEFDGPGRGLDRESPSRGERGIAPPSRPVFLLRGDKGDGYWAGIHLVLPATSGLPPRHQLLLIRADRLDGSGMFFEFKPWLWGGIAVLALSLAFWTPFVWSITRYVGRLTAATERIAAGQFKISLPPRGNDELGSLGQAIEAMAGRLDHLVSGQKRFLGDAAHELCAPLARLRTGLGILEMKLGDCGQEQIATIESDAQELATLVEEILAFSRAGNRSPRNQDILIDQIVREVAAREAGENPLLIDVAPDLRVHADPSLLARAIGNLVRNSRIHGGPGVGISISALDHPGFVEITVSDNGPGVPADELPRLFEPFYRPDLSRSRDTGGSGLGLAIVRTAVGACGGEAFASIPLNGGFSVTLRLPKTSV